MVDLFVVLTTLFLHIVLQHGQIAYLQEANLVPQPQFHTGLLQGLFMRFGEDVPKELHRIQGIEVWGIKAPSS